MTYIWEFILSCFKFLFSSNARRDYRDDYSTAFDSLHKFTDHLQKQIEAYEEKISQQTSRLDELEKIKFLARKFYAELQKCEAAYEECRKRSENSKNSS